MPRPGHLYSTATDCYIQASKYWMLFDLQASTQLTTICTGVEQVKNDFIVDLEEGTSASVHPAELFEKNTEKAKHGSAKR